MKRLLLSLSLALLVSPGAYAQDNFGDTRIPDDLPLEEYGKYWDQYNQEVSRAQAEYNKNVQDIKSTTQPGPEQRARLQERQGT